MASVTNLSVEVFADDVQFSGNCSVQGDVYITVPGGGLMLGQGTVHPNGNFKFRSLHLAKGQYNAVASPLNNVAKNNDWCTAVNFTIR